MTPPRSPAMTLTTTIKIPKRIVRSPSEYAFAPHTAIRVKPKDSSDRTIFPMSERQAHVKNFDCTNDLDIFVPSLDWLHPYIFDVCFGLRIQPVVATH